MEEEIACYSSSSETEFLSWNLSIAAGRPRMRRISNVNEYQDLGVTSSQFPDVMSFIDPIQGTSDEAMPTIHSSFTASTGSVFESLIPEAGPLELTPDWSIMQPSALLSPDVRKPE